MYAKYLFGIERNNVCPRPYPDCQVRIIYIQSEDRFTRDGIEIAVCPCSDLFSWEYYAKYVY